MRDLDALRTAAQAELRRHPRARAWWVDALLLVGVNLGVGVVLMFALTPHLEQHASEAFRQAGAAGLLIIAVGGAIAAVRPGWRSARLAVLTLAVGSVLVLLAAASGLGPGGSFFGGAGCGVLEALYSVVPVLVSTFVLSRFAPDLLRSVVGGLSAGAGGLVGLHLHCPNGTLVHLVGFHLVPWVAVSVAAVVLRRLVGSASWAP
jgi:hypothetical protein